MAKDLNKVQLTGRLGADPEMRFTPQGTAVTTFRVASNRSWKTAEGEQREDTEWFSIVAWNKLAEICNQYLNKGTRVYIEGRSQTRSWVEEQSGQTRYKTEIVANDMIILDGRREGMAYNAEEPEEEWANPPEPAPVARPAARPAAPARSNGNGNGGNTAPAKAPARSAAPAATQTRPASRKPVVTDEDDLPF
ncbi:MAG TPA: single-stranded DNA-binding protein [Herpetosiphon sp.]|uniref:Single-stranded DNA-binding protein n=1 Tax=Herpetosiphon aurantiacus (strain ATCC 23779 / DSM 785 / 114-95) TaxID=316274 RepID=A9AWI3_HERA2|nr:single-stranded DNA-binding protein [Herpetosiphon sp.]ABX06742.1 single-strand binding protein [Herpetosiphon aurantiacus DSM 785]HBW48537.1 single-stranded DNA-binding protein [Herpetosiphon sp.]